MKKKIALISLAAFGLLLSGLVGCGKQPVEPSESKPDETSQKSEESSQPSSEPSSAPSSSSSAAPSSSEITQPAVNQTVTQDVDGFGATIVWDAQDSNKDAASGFDSSGKFKAAGDYVQYVFESPMALEARLYVKIANRSGSSDSPYNRASKSGNQSIWYDYYNGPGWKYDVKVNGAALNQDEQGKVTIGEEEVELKEVTYSDFTSSTSSSTQFVAPWFTFNAVAGKNVIRIERALGYSVSVKEFQVIGRQPGAPEPFTGYQVEFVPDSHCKVFVYEGKDYTATPVETNNCIAKDEDGNIVAYDPDDIELQPQVNFKVVCDAGWKIASKDNFAVEGKYKNLKMGPDTNEGLPDAQHFRITKVQTNLKITITCVEDDGQEVGPGYLASFVTNHCTVKVYIGAKNAAGDNLDTAPYYTRHKDDPTQYTRNNGQLNFEVVPEAGYKFVSGIEEGGEVADGVPFVAGNYNKVKRVAGNVYNITKINADIAISLKCIPEGGEEGLGYEITFVTEHCSVLVYEDGQDYRFTPVAPAEGKTMSRTSKGDAAKYVAADAEQGIAEVKPQVNFLIVCEEGYEVAAANIAISGTKGTEWNKCEQGDATLNPNIWKVTKIKANLTITITAVLAAA